MFSGSFPNQIQNTLYNVHVVQPGGDTCPETSGIILVDFSVETIIGVC